MNITTFNIGLSLLSRNAVNRKDEARRILSIFEGRYITDNDIEREEGGRPYFKGKGKREEGRDSEEQRTEKSGITNKEIISDFNISHSGNMVAVSFVRGEGARTGCDVQIVKERVNTMQIAEKFFTLAEKNYIFAKKEQGNNSAFFEIWTLKECYIKLHGLSVFDMASVPDFIDESGSLNLTFNNTAFFLYKLKDKLTGKNGQQYILAVAVMEDAAIPSICPSLQWFSESSLCCEQISII